MYKNVALLSIGAALLESLFVFDVGHAVQIDRRQAVRNLIAAELNGTANAPTTQVSSNPTPCTGDGMRKTEAPCQKQRLPGSGEKATHGTRYTSTAITATLIVPLVALIVLVLLYRHIPQSPWIKRTQ